jgi:hypothetical protein
MVSTFTETLERFRITHPQPEELANLGIRHLNALHSIHEIRDLARKPVWVFPVRGMTDSRIYA